MNKRSEMVLQVIYLHFRERGGQWPTFAYLDRWLNRYSREDDAVQVFSQIPREFLKPLSLVNGRPDRESRLVLTAAGVRRCGGSDPDMQNLITAMQFLVQYDIKYDFFENAAASWAPIDQEKLVDELSLPRRTDPNSVERLMALLKSEGLVMNAPGEAERQLLYINPEIKKFKNVKNINDYLKVVARDNRFSGQGVGRWQLANILKRLHSLPISDKLALAILITGVLGLVATIFTVMITAGVHVF